MPDSNYPTQRRFKVQQNDPSTRTPASYFFKTETHSVHGSDAMTSTGSFIAALADPDGDVIISMLADLRRNTLTLPIHDARNEGVGREAARAHDWAIGDAAVRDV